DLADLSRVERRPIAGRLTDRDDAIPAEDEVDLLVVDDILVGHGDRGEQKAEHVLAMALDARPRASTVGVGRAQELGPRVGAQLMGDLLAKFLLGRVEEIDPGASRYGARVVPASARRPLREAPSERAPPPDDPRPTGAARRRARPSHPCPLRSRPDGTCGRRRRRPRTRP